jgi:phosphoribosylanthranilate isomerase
MTMWIKVCGMTTPEAVHAALDAGVDAIGFVFAESKRRITPERAAELAQPARGRVRCVAVTKHPTQAEVDAILRVFEPDLFQTDWQDLRALTLPRELSLLPVLRTAGGRPKPLPTRALFEGPISGTGVPTDWQAAHAMARRIEVILAGGLSPDNVAAAISDVRPFGVDVSSGVESSPSVKSPEKIARFVSAARAAFAAVASASNRSASAPLHAKETLP